MRCSFRSTQINVDPTDPRMRPRRVGVQLQCTDEERTRAALVGEHGSGSAKNCQTIGIICAWAGGGLGETFSVAAVTFGIGRPLVDATLHMTPGRQCQSQRIVRCLAQNDVKQRQCRWLASGSSDEARLNVSRSRSPTFRSRPPPLSNTRRSSVVWINDWSPLIALPIHPVSAAPAV